MVPSESIRNIKLEEVFTLAKSGMTMTELSEHFGYAEGSIYRIARKQGYSQELKECLRIGRGKRKEIKAVSIFCDIGDIEKVHDKTGFSVEFIAKSLHNAVLSGDMNPVQCENCDGENDFSYSSGRFCCMQCARSFATKDMSEESLDKK